MTSTPVKDVGLLFANPNGPQPGKSAANTGEFQRVWSNQMNQSTLGNYVPDNFAQSSTQSNTSAKPPETDTNAGSNVQKPEETVTQPSKESDVAEETTVETDGVSAVGDVQNSQPEDMTTEELERAMEVLGTAAANLMQQIADAFGISMEELQAVMDELGMDQMNLLNADDLGGLLLKLGGAQDSWALLTDEALYGNYRTLMEQLKNVTEESAKTLGIEPGQMEALLEKIPAREAEADVAEMSRPEDPVQTTDTADVTITAEALANVKDETGDVSGKQTEGQSDQTREDKRQDSGKAEVEQPVQVFGQDMRMQQFQPETVQAQNVVENSGWSADTRNIMNQIMDYMKFQLSADTTSMEMQLHPASLGTLRVQIDSTAGVLTAHFITQNENVKAALESQIAQLQENFEEQGVKVEAIEVTVQTHEFEQNLEQGRDRNQSMPEKKNRIRRIQLGDPLAMETMEEEDALRADMMAASGNTVDYTV